jgi:hypothetical protein
MKGTLSFWYNYYDIKIVLFLTWHVEYNTNTVSIMRSLEVKLYDDDII